MTTTVLPARGPLDSACRLLAADSDVKLNAVAKVVYRADVEKLGASAMRLLAPRVLARTWAHPRHRARRTDLRAPLGSALRTADAVIDDRWPNVGASWPGIVAGQSVHE
ncbi:hypothetical protein [Amycolatopsis pithecellobii]|uniref:Uncharacterized protein n=1 Tax=Amycolatopsis pithecellobii TaxID=664692 RepID=A0A6N7Z1N5_9PSEU|nr:hypothetical protein [Amycolatopsis pithecellobii]MTD52406.1 hypothetical protein [Amycolatopsis pithecellobii]